MPNYSTLLFEVRDHVAHITLNRPDAANGINLEMASELRHAARRCATDPDVRAVLLAGAGKMFCAGGDLKAFAAQPEGELAGFLEQVTLHLHQAVAHFARMNAPVVAAIQGSAAGGGFSLACACDFPIAAESAKFTMAYTRAGLTPDGSSTYFLPRIVGHREIDAQGASAPTAECDPLECAQRGAGDRHTQEHGGTLLRLVRSSAAPQQEL